MILLISKGHINNDGESIYKLVVYAEQDKTKKKIFFLSGISFGHLMEKLEILNEFWQLEFSPKINTFINGKAMRKGETIIYEADPLDKKEFEKIKRFFMENKNFSSFSDL